MKNVALAIFLTSSLVACAASDGEDAAASTEAVTTGTLTHTVEVDIASSAAQCRIIMGSFIELAFDGRIYRMYAADDFGTCQKRLDEIVALGLERPLQALLVEEFRPTHVKRSLVIEGRWTLDAWEAIPTR